MINGYKKLMASVKNDCEVSGCFNPEGCNSNGNSHCFHRYCDKFKWAIDRAKHYGEKLGLDWQAILNSWEEKRNYWYMSYYQERNQPEINNENVRAFETVEEMLQSLDKKGFHCPMCKGITKSPYECDTGLEMSKGKICDWKVYGLLGHLGRGIFIYCKDQLRGENIFMPVAWEKVNHESSI